METICTHEHKNHTIYLKHSVVYFTQQQMPNMNTVHTICYMISSYNLLSCYPEETFCALLVEKKIHFNFIFSYNFCMHKQFPSQLQCIYFICMSIVEIKFYFMLDKMSYSSSKSAWGKRNKKKKEFIPVISNWIWCVPKRFKMDRWEFKSFNFYNTHCTH